MNPGSKPGRHEPKSESCAGADIGRKHSPSGLANSPAGGRTGAPAANAGGIGGLAGGRAARALALAFRPLPAATRRAGFRAMHGARAGPALPRRACAWQGTSAGPRRRPEGDSMAEAPKRAMRRRGGGALRARSGRPETGGRTVERVTFHSEETGFCVLRVNAARQREPVTVVGTAATVGPGEFVEATGAWVNDRNHGLQFRAEHLRVVPPSTLEGIEKYLGSGMIRGIGPHFAAQLVRAFGAEVFEVIENEPARLVELPGIGPKRKARWWPRGRSRRRSARSWSFCSRTGWGRPGRCASTGSTETRRWIGCARTPTGSPSTFAASASARRMRSRSRSDSTPIRFRGRGRGFATCCRRSPARDTARRSEERSSTPRPSCSRWMRKSPSPRSPGSSPKTSW